MFECEYQKFINHVEGPGAWHEYFCILFQDECN